MLKGRIRPFALAAGIASVVAALIVGGVAAPAMAATSVATADARILADTNALRAQHGLAPLVENPAIDAVAQGWANRLGAGATFDHNPSFFSQMPAGADAAGENIAGGFLYTTVVNSGWANSPGHLANMLGDYTDIGIGYWESADGRTTFFVQDFGHYPSHVGQTATPTASATPTPTPTPTPTSTPSPSPTPSSTATAAAASAPSSGLVALSSLPAPVASTATAPIPKVVGNKLVDSRTGATWTAHAVNWPSFEYACQQGWAYAQDGRTDAAAKAMVSWGVNAVRLPLNEDCWLGTDGSPRYGSPAGYQQAVRQWVDILNANGIVVILDLHWSGGTGLDSSGQRPFLDDQSPLFWQQVSYAYSKVPSVMFDAFNEPYSTGSYKLTWSCWLNGGCAMPTVLDGQTPGSSTYTTTGMKDVVAAIRGAGATQPVLLGGLDYSNDLRGWLANRPSDSQLVASWHNYPGQRCQTVDCWNSEIAPVAAQVPVIATEFGETDGGTSFLTTFMNWADAKGVGYSPWAWWWTDASDGAEANAYALIQNGSFTPNAPEGTTYHDHLVGLTSPPVTTPPATPVLASGSLVKSASASAVFFVDGSRKLPLTSFDVAAQFGVSGYSVVSDAALAAYPTASSPLSVFVTCGSVTGVVSGGRLVPVPAPQLPSAAVVSLSSSACGSLSVAPAVTGRAYLLAPDGTIWGLFAGVRRPFSSMAALIADAGGIPSWISMSWYGLDPVPTGAPVR
jgi:endoglucanase